MMFDVSHLHEWFKSRGAALKSCEALVFHVMWRRGGVKSARWRSPTVQERRLQIKEPHTHKHTHTPATQSAEQVNGTESCCCPKMTRRHRNSGRWKDQRKGRIRTYCFYESPHLCLWSEASSSVSSAALCSFVIGGEVRLGQHSLSTRPALLPLTRLVPLWLSRIISTLRGER